MTIHKDIRFFDIFSGMGWSEPAGLPVSATARLTNTQKKHTGRHTISKKTRCFMKTQEKSTQKPCQSLTYSAEDSPARHFLSLAGEKDLTMPEVLSSLRLPDWLEKDGLRIFSLKTSQDCYRMTKAGHLRPSSIRFATWGTVSNSRCLTAKILAFPSPDAGCTLSDILTPDVSERYYLSEEQTRKLLSAS